MTKPSKPRRRAAHLTRDAVKAVPLLEPRARDAHKGDLGRVLVVAGSAAMPGAAYLCAQAAMRAGAGLCTIAVPEPLLPVMGAKAVVQTLTPLPATRQGTVAPRAKSRILELTVEFDAVALGPGLTRHPETARLIRQVAISIDKPLVLDADGLNAFEGRAGSLASRRAPTILTPHPGEAARLLGCAVADIQRDRPAAARRLARLAGAIVNLKGAGTVVTDGESLHINPTGNPAMASGGSGDVLSGVMAALLARGLDALDAAILAAFVHGRAGDLAASRLGENGCIATDLLDYLPLALRERVRRS